MNDFSTPSPIVNEITAVEVEEIGILTTNPLPAADEIHQLEDSLNSFKSIEDKQEKQNQLENILTEEMKLLASLRKSDIELKDELRIEL